MIPVYKAYQFIQRLEGGTTRPWLILVDTGGKEPEKYVLKFFSSKDLNDDNFIAHEFICNWLANELDLSTPEVSLISIDDDFISTIPTHLIPDLQKCPRGLFFGSKHILAQEYSPALHNRYLTKDDIPNILAFDMLVLNTDRRKEKPNLLMEENDFVLIDHEKAMVYDSPNLNQIPFQITNHLLFDRAKKLYRANGPNIFDSFKFYLDNLNLKPLYPIVEQLEDINLANSKELIWIEYLQNITNRNSNKFLDLLIHLLQ